MVKKKKILIFAVPFYGHVNPMTGMIYEMVNKKTYDVIFYGTEDMRTLIEKTGAEFRLYSYFPMQKFKRKPTNIKQDSAVIHTLLELMDISSRLVPDLLRIVEHEKPDLIMYDMWALHTKYLLKILNRSYEKQGQQKLTRSPQTASAMFTPFFAWKENVYPNAKEFRMMVAFDFKYLLKLAVLFYKQMCLNWQFGLFIFNPLRLFFQPNDKINIVPIFYELQPRAEQFDKTFHFVGCCISEQVRSMHIDNEKLQVFMNKSPAINPIQNFNQIKDYETQPKLIYVSLGTIFNNNFYIFDIIIEAIRKLDNNAKSSKFRAIFSVGSEVYDLYEKKIKHGKYELPESIILLSSAPQIEILKRASLFITHAGMNSIAESIHYSVPVICIPIQVDQPLVALRVSDELQLGKQFHYDRLDANELKEAIWEILYNRRYLEKMIIYSAISRKNHGSHKSAQIIDDFMKKLL